VASLDADVEQTVRLAMATAMNSFNYLELHSTAPDEARRFYTQLFGWKTVDKPVPAEPPFVYTEIMPEGGPPAGLRPNFQPGAPSHWLAYVNVPNLEVATQKARELGAKVVRERVEVGGEGAFVVLQDPSGAQIGLWETLQPR